ncbi:MAG: HAD family hydrolase [Promethearchaeota archaeon]
MTIKAIIFDLGGVIVEFDFSKFFKEIIKISPLNKPDTLLLLEFWRQSDIYHQGKISNKQFYHQACEILQTCAINQEKFFEAFNSVIDHINEDIVELIKKIKDIGKYKLILLSNINESHWKFLKGKNWGFIKYFDELILSHKIHMIKPDPKIFSYTLHLADCKPEEILYIDDGFNNVLLAREFSINAFKFTTYNDLVTLLNDNKIL